MPNEVNSEYHHNRKSNIELLRIIAMGMVSFFNNKITVRNINTSLNYVYMA